MKNIVITGKSGYIANSLKFCFERRNENLTIELLDVRNEGWRSRSFLGIDTVIHTAALVHKNEKAHPFEEYRRVNTELTRDLATKAKADGVNHFIFMSTMSVYGVEPSLLIKTEITSSTPLEPVTKYGRTKRNAELELNALADEDFKVAIVRPPFVYGKGCPGNYQVLRKLTLTLRVIPKLSNQKSMIYIDNLVELVYLIGQRRLDGIFMPQNAGINSTWELSRLIAKYNDKKVVVTPLLNPFLYVASLLIPKIRRAFGNEYYSLDASQPEGLEYAVAEFEDSVRQTEA